MLIPPFRRRESFLSVIVLACVYVLLQLTYRSNRSRMADCAMSLRANRGKARSPRGVEPPAVGRQLVRSLT